MSVWREGPWDLPTPAKPRPTLSNPPQEPARAAAQPVVGTEAIVSKNLFDPERGAVKTQESEVDARAIQKVRSLVLLGTAIIGPSSYAIVQEPDNAPVPGLPNQQRSPGVRRLKLGDSVEGFSVSEITDKRVLLTKGATRVEVSVDYFRKIAPAAGGTVPGIPPGGPVVVPAQPVQPGTPAPGPNVIPNLPRRPRLPTPPGP